MWKEMKAGQLVEFLFLWTDRQTGPFPGLAGSARLTPRQPRVAATLRVGNAVLGGSVTCPRSERYSRCGCVCLTACNHYHTCLNMRVSQMLKYSPFFVFQNLQNQTVFYNQRHLRAHEIRCQHAAPGL